MSETLKKMLQNHIFRGGAIFFLAGIAGNAFNYIYRLILGRMLTPADFGEVVAALSLMLILGAPTAPLQVAGTKFVAELKARGDFSRIKSLLVRFTWLISAVALVVGIAAFIFSENATKFLNFSSEYTFLIVMAALIFWMVSSTGRGVLMGLERFNKFSAITIIESAFRLVGGIILVILGFKVFGALIGVAASIFLAMLLSFWFVRDIFKEKDGTHFKLDKNFIKYTIYTLLAFLFLNVLLNLDVVLVKRYFSAQEAGLYSAFSSVGRLVFVMGTILSGVMLPIVTRKKENGENFLKPFVVTSFITVGLTTVLAILSFLFPETIINIFFGEQYIDGGQYLGFYTIIMGLMALIFIIGYFFMALSRFYFVYVLIGASILEAALIAKSHSSFEAVLHSFSISLVACLIFLLFPILKLRYEK